LFANKVINRVIGKIYKVSTVAYPTDFVETVVMEGGLLGMHNRRLRGETIAEHDNDNVAEERTGEWLLGAGFVEPSR
jgi:hypothetical protein